MTALRYLAVGVVAFAGFTATVPVTEQGFVPFKMAYAADEEFLGGAEQFISNLSSEAVGFLSDESLSEAQKKAQFKKFLNKSFDMKTIGRFAMGRYWKTATPAQRAEYQKEFEKMVVGVYSSRFSEYNGQNIEVRKARRDSEKDATVHSVIMQDSGPEVQLDWRVRYKDGRYKVVDVIVEGVSMAVTQRSDFSSVIQRGGGDVDVLLAHLREQ